MRRPARTPLGPVAWLVMAAALVLAGALVFGPRQAGREAQDPALAGTGASPRGAPDEGGQDGSSEPGQSGAPSVLEAQSQAAGAPSAAVFASVLPGRPLVFPRDHGAHRDHRTEWWYVTGWLEDEGRPIGFQVTFFRIRTGMDEANPSAFAARQVLFAHAALSDPRVGRLLHDQRIAREGLGLAEAATADADLRLDGWRLRRRPDGVFETRISGGPVELDLELRPGQPVLLQGRAGYSQKGPDPAQASYYYSLPHLRVEGVIRREGRARKVRGEAWMDREWSSTLLDPRAVGWDWTGLNLQDGSALTAFQVRDASGAPLWAGGSLRTASGQVHVFQPGDVRFTTLRTWRSPRTGASWPIEREVEVRAFGGVRRFRLRPLFDDQELDSRASGGPIYWEGAVSAEGARGYLELTGYLSPLRM